MIVTGTNIYITRGDSESLSVALQSTDGFAAPLTAGDKVYLTIKENINTADKILQFVVKEFVDGKAIINILPSDTAALDYGVYVYDIQVTLADGTKRTIVRPSNFEIGGEVTYE